jgi:hypothetical protein
LNPYQKSLEQFFSSLPCLISYFNRFFKKESVSFQWDEKITGAIKAKLSFANIFPTVKIQPFLHFPPLAITIIVQDQQPSNPIDSKL